MIVVECHCLLDGATAGDHSSGCNRAILCDFPCRQRRYRFSRYAERSLGRRAKGDSGVRADRSRCQGRVCQGDGLCEAISGCSW